MVVAYVPVSSTKRSLDYSTCGLRDHAIAGNAIDATVGFSSGRFSHELHTGIREIGTPCRIPLIEGPPPCEHFYRHRSGFVDISRQAGVRPFIRERVLLVRDPVR